MDLNIRAGQRVLYKKNGSNWLVGEIGSGTAAINENGLYLPIWAIEDLKEMRSQGFSWDGTPDYTLININDLFLDSFKIDEAIKEYKEYFMTKTEYIAYIESDDFNRQLENACVSDGEYGYYPVSKFTKNWLEKQPFEYIVRSDY